MVDLFFYESPAALNVDLPAFDPFDPDMSARDRRDVADTYRSPIAWRALADVQGALIAVEALGHVYTDAFPRSVRS